MGDFGITTSAGALVFGAPVEAPADTFTYTAATLQVAPGTYTLAELALAGYAPSDWTCTNGGGGAFDAGSVTLAAGDPTVTCSITNDDQPVALVIRKVVVNDDGGSAVVGDFGITTSAGALAFGAAVEPRPTPSPTPPRPCRSRPARTAWPSSPWPATRRPTGPAPTAAAAPSTRAASPSPRATRRSPARSPRRPARRPRHPQGRRQRRRRQRGRGRLRDHDQRRRARLRGPVEAPADTFTYTAATLQVAPGTYSLAELALAGYTPSDWTCTNGGGGAVRRGQRHPRRGRPDGHLLDHQRRQGRGERWSGVRCSGAAEYGVGSGHRGHRHPAIRASRGKRCCS